MRRFFTSFFALFPVVCLLTSCVEEMKKADFENRIRRHATETINNVWYVGSTEGYDYFVHNTATQSRQVRVKEREVTLASRFRLTDDKKKWEMVKGDADPFLRENPIESLDNHPDFHAVPSHDKSRDILSEKGGPK